MKPYILHLSNPAVNWENVTPTGSGKLGLALYGRVGTEQLRFNEETIWSGGPMNTKVEGYREILEKTRALYLADHEWEADQYATEAMKDCFFRIHSYEYAGEVTVQLHEDDACENYRRDLNLTHGVGAVCYDKDGVSYRREVFCSHPAGLACARFTATAPFAARIAFRRENIDRLTYQRDHLTALCHTAVGSNAFTLTTRIVTDGNTAADALGITVADATYVILYTAIATAFRHDDMTSAIAAMLSGSDSGWDALLAEHIADFSAIMERTDITFDPEDDALSDMPVSARLERLKNDPDAEDASLISLYYQFGKYLLVSSSREDSLPANLQGVWSEGISAPWNADYHTNINLQMNYWPAEEAGLSESVSSLFGYMNDYLLPGGKRVAAENYGARGMVVHHISDIYGFAAAGDGIWGLWPVGGAWLAFHMWEHYLYTGDRGFLRDTAYEYIRSCALFFFDTLFDDGHGGLLSGPSTSPENTYYVEVNGEKKRVYLAVSPTMDTEIIGGLLRFYAETEDILAIHPEDGEKAREMAARLPALRVGKYGQLMEWRKDYEEAEPGHRHISHAFALYPAAQITRDTPELYAAIRTTLERRLSSGGGHTGWSRAWLINLFARLRSGEDTYENIRALFTKSTLPNLWDTHAPFQIDGNFGGTAGIGEMVMQSHEGFISLLPALSEKLANGSFTGLRARGQKTVSASWKNGVVESISITEAGGVHTTVEVPCAGVYTADDGTEYPTVNGRITIDSTADTVVLHRA